VALDARVRSTTACPLAARVRASAVPRKPVPPAMTIFICSSV
jgi:hypothetical protein